MNEMSFRIRPIGQNECGILLDLIQELAEYEKLADQVKATEASLYKAIFEDQHVHAIFLESENKVIGFALYFFNFSTFVGRKGLYLEDLYIQPAFRSKGYGRAMFQHLIQTAKNNQCGRMEWTVLNWNESAIHFYESFQAKPLSDWTIYRLGASELNSL